MICYISSYCLNIYFGQIIIKRTWLRKKIVLTQFGYYPAFNHILISISSASFWHPVCRASQVHTRAFPKKLIAYTKIVALHAAALGLRDLHLTYRGVDMIIIFCQVYHNLSVIPHHFHIPCLHFCFLISMVRLRTNEWTGNLPVILFVALLMSKLNAEAWTY